VASAPASPRPAATPRLAVTRTVSDVLLGGDGAIGEFVRVTGTLQMPDAGRDLFDLRQGAYAIEVRYPRLSVTDKARVRTLTAGSTVVVTGVVARDPELGTYYLNTVTAAAP